MRRYMGEQEWLDIFGDNLRDILKEYGMTQRQLAEETGLTEATISNYINKRKIPSMRAIVNIANALDISTDELINLDDRIV